MESDDPPPKVYGFKERAFKRDERPSTTSSPPNPTTKELAKMAGPVTRSVPVPTGAKADDPNDVYNALEKNRVMERGAGLDQVAIKRIKSRRNRDYWMLLLSTEALIATMTYIGRQNPVFLIFGLAGMFAAALLITWIMFQLMSRY